MFSAFCGFSKKNNFPIYVGKCGAKQNEKKHVTTKKQPVSLFTNFVLFFSVSKK